MGFGMTCGAAYSWSIGMTIISVCLFILASFIFSVIFWLTQKWVDEQVTNAPKKKK
ncbi:hypothetical protein H6504_05250 [Candidatus Woesearchaeota archaeon]|nr:hypothetical protein [Candidatus Woesearchaeota archaeon]